MASVTVEMVQIGRNALVVLAQWNLGGLSQHLIEDTVKPGNPVSRWPVGLSDLPDAQ